MANTKKVFSKIKSSFEKSEFGYLSQIIILYIIIIFCLIQLHKETVKNRDLIISLLSSSVGVLMPNPKIKKKYNGEQQNSNNSSRESIDT